MQIYTHNQIYNKYNYGRNYIIVKYQYVILRMQNLRMWFVRPTGII